jgi:hypothetical protein
VKARRDWHLWVDVPESNALQFRAVYMYRSGKASMENSALPRMSGHARMQSRQCTMRDCSVVKSARGGSRIKKQMRRKRDDHDLQQSFALSSSQRQKRDRAVRYRSRSGSMRNARALPMPQPAGTVGCLRVCAYSRDSRGRHCRPAAKKVTWIRT